MLCLCRQTHKKNSISLKGKPLCSIYKGKMEQDTVLEFTGIFTQEGTAPCLRLVLLKWRGSRRWLGSVHVGTHYQPALHPYFQPDLVLLQQFQSQAVVQDRINKVQNETEEQTYTSQTNQERKFLDEEKKAKFFTSKFTFKCTVISSYLPVYDQILFFQTCHHTLPKF